MGGLVGGASGVADGSLTGTQPAAALVVGGRAFPKPVCVPSRKLLLIFATTPVELVRGSAGVYPGREVLCGCWLAAGGCWPWRGCSLAEAWIVCGRGFGPFSRTISFVESPAGPLPVPCSRLRTAAVALRGLADGRLLVAARSRRLDLGAAEVEHRLHVWGWGFCGEWTRRQCLLSPDAGIDRRQVWLVVD